MAPPGGAESQGRSITLSYVIFAVVLLGTFAAGVAAGYLVHTAPSAACAPHVVSGTPVPPEKLSSANLKAYVSRCHDICVATTSVGINVSSGICLNNDLNGYACAVVVGDSGHCPAYSRGAPELVFDASCKYVGVYRKGGSR